MTQQANINMLSIAEAVASSNTCRSTINARIKAWDDAVAAGKTPPPGALQSKKWGGRRLIRDTWLARSLGIDGDQAA
jgi:hypothetical protein